MDMTVIDVREADEYSNGHYEGALNIPLSTIPNNPKLGKLPKDTPLVLYCRSGNRSEQALQALKKLGYSNLTNGINQAILEKDS